MPAGYLAEAFGNSAPEVQIVPARPEIKSDFTEVVRQGALEELEKDPNVFEINPPKKDYDH